MATKTKGTRDATSRRIGNGMLAMLATASMIGATVAPAATAYAATEEEISAQLADAQGTLDQAEADVKQLETDIKESEDRITQITKQLPERRESAADTMKALYKEMSTHNLHLDIILNSDNVEQVMEQLTALEDVQSTSFGQINSLTNEVAQNASDNVERKEQLEVAKQTVEEQTENVASIKTRLKRVKNAPPAIEGCEPIDWSASDEEIVAKWAPRIDAYLKGHGLEGQGETFVRAGIKYGVDPRFSAAISNTESTRGDFCFASHNAWGWMGQSFSNWKEAIYAHSKYLTCNYYHARLDAQTAQTYCPPTWDSWLANTLSAAQSI